MTHALDNSESECAETSVEVSVGKSGAENVSSISNKNFNKNINIIPLSGMGEEDSTLKENYINGQIDSMQQESADSAPVLEIEQKIQDEISCTQKDLNGFENVEIQDVAIKVDETKEVQQKNINIFKRYFLKKTKGLTRRQILILVVFAFVELFAATVISIQAPFYPQEAEKKGATATQHGMVFSVFELIVFIMSPVFGTKMNTWNPKKIFNCGIFVTGASCFVFGFLNHIESSFWFIAISIVVRVIEAVGDAAFVTASFTIIALEFPDSVATTFATMETFYGFGMILGPTLGGFLYHIGGYLFPFAIMGGSLFVCAVATYYILPNISTENDTELKYVNEERKSPIAAPPTSSGFAIFKMIAKPPIAIIAFSIVASASGIGFLADTLQPYLKEEFHIEKAYIVGCIFVLHGGTYALTAPIWGRICDKVTQQKYMTLIGSMFIIVAFTTVGPLPIFPVEPTLWGTCISLVLFGLGLGATLVSAFMQMMTDSIANGYPDDISTYGQVSGLWTSMAALGFFIGPLAGGILLDHVGFRNGTLFVVAGQILVIGLVVFYIVRMHKKSRNVCLQEVESAPEGDQRVKERIIFSSISDLATDNASYTPSNTDFGGFIEKS